MEEKGNSLLVVAEVYCRYKSPAFYDDVLLLRSRISEIRSRSIRFIYEILRPADNMLLAEGETLHVVTDENKKVRTLPEIYRTKLLQTVENTNPFPENEAPH